MKTVNLEEWTLSGQGAQGKSYYSKTNPELMMKLFGEEVDTDSILEEYRLSRIAVDLGINTPDPGEIVTDGVHKGLLFKRIQNKRSICRIISEQPERLEEMARVFARECKQFHSLKYDSEIDLPDYRENMLKMIDHPFFSTRKKTFITDLVKSMPEPDCIAHGDMHFGNMINDGHNNYFIDLGFLSKGTLAYDLSMLKFICFDMPAKTCKEMFHISQKQAQEFWHIFVDEFFGADKSALNMDEINRCVRFKIECIGRYENIPTPLVYLVSGHPSFLFKPFRL